MSIFADNAFCTAVLCSSSVYFFAETLWSLRHFGHLSHSCIKTHRSSVQLVKSVFSDILMEMTYFSVISEAFTSITETNPQLR